MKQSKRGDKLINYLYCLYNIFYIEEEREINWKCVTYENVIFY